ncbi:MAG: alkaline phosphatase family protein [Candidatus Sulfotelmatobacter sp.]
MPSKPLTDTIEHIVVLMLENRSFDNVFGGLYPQLTQSGAFRGLTGSESNLLDPSNPKSEAFKVFQSPATDPTTYAMPDPDPGELFTDMNEQLFGPPEINPAPAPMSGFVANYVTQKCMGTVCPEAAEIMQYYSAATMPVSYFLAQNFAVCDTWFASGPVQTIANRIFAHCGTPGLVYKTNDSRINNPDFFAGMSIDYFWPPVNDFTVFQALDKAYPDGAAPAFGELNWKVYYHDAPLSVLCKYVFDRWLLGNVHHYDDELLGKSFKQDVQDNTLPMYSFIEPCYSDFFGGVANSNHPGGAGIDVDDPNGSSLPPPIDVRAGELLLSDVYQTLCGNAELFKKTMLIVTYDEHGGIYDHVAPPAAVTPFNPAVANFPYNRYGVRVPMLFINPYVAPGTIYPPRQAQAPIALPPHDHTSLIQTVMQQFAAPAQFNARVAQAPTISGIVGSQYRTPSAPPAVAYTPPVTAPRAAIAKFQKDAPTLGGVLSGLYKHIQEWKLQGLLR